MNTYFVFHRDAIWFMHISGAMSPDVLGWPGRYHLVAMVEATSFQDAWEKTQHVEGNWQDNHGVTPTTPNARSTSVGDVITQFPEGPTQIVADIGFQPFAPVSLVETCFVCGQPVSEDAHWCHEPGCNGEGCDCDLVAHPGCCFCNTGGG